jgi:hypothetical protein
LRIHLGINHIEENKTRGGGWTEIWYTWAPVIPIKKITKNYISKFQKNLKTNYDVASIVFLKRVNFQLEIICILGYTKITNL